MKKTLIFFALLATCKPKTSGSKQSSGQFMPSHSVACRQLRATPKGTLCLTEYGLWKVVSPAQVVGTQKNVSFDRQVAQNFAGTLSPLLKTCVQGNGAQIKLVVSSNNSVSVLIPLNQKRPLNKAQKNCLNQMAKNSLPVPYVTATQVVNVNISG